MKVVQFADNFMYDDANGYGYIDTAGLDRSVNNRNILDGDDEIYDQFIGTKGEEYNTIRFRFDVPNGTYRFVAAGGDARYGGHGTTIRVMDERCCWYNGRGIALVESAVLDANHFFRVGFGDKGPPMWDGSGVEPTFLPMAPSPALDVESGMIIVAQQAEGAANGGDLCLLEAWRLPLEKVRPVLERVVSNDDGTFTAHFGYLNENSYPVSVPCYDYYACDNCFTGGGLGDRCVGQSTLFKPGRIVDAFAVTFNGEPLVRTLNGRTATASGQ